MRQHGHVELTDFTERRYYLRQKIEIQVHLWNADLNLTGMIFDLSGGGMNVITSKVLPAEAELRVSFEIPEAGKISCTARVMWASEHRRAGLQFIDLDEERRSVITSWVKEQNLRALASKGI